VHLGVLDEDYWGVDGVLTLPVKGTR
jgi:hypothetical protein